MNVTIKLQARALLKGTVSPICPPSIPCAHSSTASVVCEKGGFLVTTSVRFDSNGLGRKDVGISACVVPHIDPLRLARAVVVPIGGDHV